MKSSWNNQVGSFTATAGTMKSVGIGSVATLQGVQIADVSAQVDVVVPAGTAANPQSAGLVTRYSGPGDKNYYYSAIYHSGSGYTAEVWRNAANVWTRIYQAPVSTGAGTLRVKNVGAELRLFYNQQVLTVLNDANLTTGAVGLRGSSLATLDNFQANAIAVTNATLPFQDDFDPASGTDLRSMWKEPVGSITVPGTTATASAAPENMAILRGINQSVQSVEAQVAVLASAGSQAGVVARYTETGNKSYYFAFLERTATAYRVALYKHVNGIWTNTPLAQAPQSDGVAKIKLVTNGSLLQVFVDDLLTLTATDFSLASGSMGVRGGANVTFDNFTAS